MTEHTPGVWFFAALLRRTRSAAPAPPRAARRRPPVRPSVQPLEDRLAPARVTIDTQALTVTREGDPGFTGQVFYGVPFVASVTPEGVAQFRIRGDLTVPAGD